MPAKELADWLSRLEQLHPSEIELGLERVGAVASRMGLAEPVPRVVTIAGTNGKGTTAAVLDGDCPQYAHIERAVCKAANARSRS